MSAPTASGARSAGASPARTAYVSPRTSAHASGGAATSSAPIGALHRWAGNRAVTALLHAPRRDARAAGALSGAPGGELLRDATRAPGEPLDADTREVMERAFGQELGSVRVHRDAEAARSADALDALAFTSGSRIVFGPGQYAPSTPEGRRLLAHELAHVIQQRDASRLTAAVSPTHDVFEHAASVVGPAGWLTSAQPVPAVQRQPKPAAKDPAPPTIKVGSVNVVDPAELAKKLAPAELVKLTIEFFTTQQKIYSGVPSAPGDDGYVGQLLGLWKRTIEVTVDVLHGKMNDDSALTADVKKAYAGTVATAVTAHAASLKQTVHTLLQSHRDDIHEWGWPADVAERDADTLSDAIPEADRKRIKVVSTTPIAPGMIDVGDLFSKGTTVSLPADADAAFSGGVPEKLRAGLKNVAGVLSRRMTPPPLTIDHTISLALDLGAVGGDYGMYRFTYYTQHAPTRPVTKRMLVERLGSLGMEGLAPSASADVQKRFSAHSFRFTGQWTEEQRNTVRRALTLVSDARLTPLDRLAFARAADDPKTTDAGNYDPDKHVLTLFDRAFAPSAVRFGAPGTGVVGQDVYVVAHEIGHALDYRAYRQGNANETAALAALRARFGQYESPAGSMNFSGFAKSEQPEFNKLLAAVNGAQAAAGKPKTESGHVLKQGTLVEDPKAKTDFRAAIAKDGARATDYSDKAWEEAFAEAYALYMSDAATLQRLRPAVYAYFAKRFPR
jgi:hypothetical protein